MDHIIFTKIKDRNVYISRKLIQKFRVRNFANLREIRNFALLILREILKEIQEFRIHNFCDRNLYVFDFFRNFSAFPNVFADFPKCSDPFGPVRTHTDLFGPAQMRSEAFQTRSDMFGKIWKSWIFGDDFACFRGGILN